MRILGSGHDRLQQPSTPRYLQWREVSVHAGRKQLGVYADLFRSPIELTIQAMSRMPRTAWRDDDRKERSHRQRDSDTVEDRRSDRPGLNLTAQPRVLKVKTGRN
jgi:hypothetical protein